MDERDRLEDIFAEALSVPVGERTSFLEARCGGNRELITEVRSLLESHREASSFLEEPVAVVAAGDDGDPGRSDDPCGERVGSFTLEKLLGEGGCGRVYRAMQERPVRREVAIKVLRPGMQSREMLARFNVERQALVQLDHPNIAKLFEAGQTGQGLPYFAMEYVRGRPITKHCEAGGLGTDARLGLFVAVCHAVQHVHLRGIIHRDLKPSNILVSEEDGQPKVIDFGIAKSSEGRLVDQTLATQAGAMVGTLEYMSPEQIKGVPGGVDARTDVYALGVVLYELLTGSRPFEVSSLGVTDAQRWICEHEPLRASTRVLRLSKGASTPATYRELKGDLDWIVLKAMDKEAARRYTTVSELAADVERFRNKEPIHARPPSWGYRARKFISRNRTITAAAAVVAAALVGATIVSVVSAGRAWRAESRATEAAVRSERVAYRNSILAASSNIGRDPKIAAEALQSAPEVHRDWEWQYLQGRVDEAPAFYENGGDMSALAASKDGNSIVVGFHRKGKLLWWSRNSAEPIELSGHALRIQSCDFSPDGARLVTGSSDGTVRLWDLKSRESVVVGAFGQGVSAVAFDGTGTRIAAGGRESKVHVWDVQAQPRVSYVFEATDPVYAITFVGQNGARVAAGTSGGKVSVWDLSDGRRLHETVAGQQPIRAILAIHRDSEVIVGDMSGALSRLDLDTGQKLHTYSKPGQSAIRAIATNAEQSLVAVGNSRGDIEVWERLSGVRVARQLGRDGGIEGLAFLGSSDELVSASWRGAARVWQFGHGRAKRVIRHSRSPVNSIAFGSDQRHIAAATDKGVGGRWVMSTGEPVEEFGTREAKACSLDSTGRFMTRCGAEGTVEVCDLVAAMVRARFNVPEEVTVSAVSSDASVVAVGSESGAVRVWGAAQGAFVREIRGQGGCTSIAVSPDARFVAAGFRDGQAALIDLRNDTGDAVVGDWGVPITSTAFRSDSHLVAFGFKPNSEAAIRTIDTHSRRVVREFGTGGMNINAMAFSASGKRLATDGENYAVRIWSVDDGNELLALRDLDGDVNAVAFSTDGHRMAVSTITGSLFVFGDKEAAWSWPPSADQSN